MSADSMFFRHVLGHYPTGVCVITAIGGNDRPVGMAVGSFTSVSLDPPLVGFLPDARSSTWPQIEAIGRFCVNILADDQMPVCRQFAEKSGDRFASVPFRRAPSGSPVLDGVVEWIDCDLDAVHPAGDHFFVTGLVREMQVQHARSPLLFVRGGYGGFTPLSLVG